MNLLLTNIIILHGEMKMDKKTITKETHTQCRVEILRQETYEYDFLVPNHLIDEDGCLDEEFEKKITDLFEWGYVNTDDCHNIDCEHSVENGCEIQDDFDPDLPLVETLINDSGQFS